MAYANVDYMGSIDDYCSTNEYSIFFGGYLITSQSKKQNIVIHFLTKAEYCAMAHAVSELIWLDILLFDLSVHSNSLASLWCDNKAAIHIVHNPSSMNVPNIEIDFHFIQDWILPKEVCVHRKKTSVYLYQGSSLTLFSQFLSHFSLTNICTPTRRECKRVKVYSFTCQLRDLHSIRCPYVEMFCI